MSLQDNITAQLQAQIAAPGDAQAKLNNSLRLLSKWRCVLIQNTLLQQNGTRVMAGPLQGLDFLPQSAEGCHIPKLLGCYEQPLHPFLERVVQLDYPLILNIGCAEGYYAVGLARRMPATKVMAYDLNPVAQEVCRTLAEKNDVSDRVSVGALFRPEDFAAYSGKKVLLMCDIEGAEKALLDPQLAPALRHMDMIVESHECLVPGITNLLIERFRHTHEINLIQDNGQRTLPQVPEWFSTLANLDQLLAVWEWRSGPTPWLVMSAWS